MAMQWRWPWAARPAAGARLDRKQADAYGFVALHMQAEASWTRRDYAALAREGFMRNPVAYRCVRLIAEAAAAVPWLLYEGGREHAHHPLKALLERPNPRQAGAAFMEALYGHLLISGNAYVEPVEAGGMLRELHLLRPDRVKIATDAAGWPTALTYREGGRSRTVPLAGEGASGALHVSLSIRLTTFAAFRRWKQPSRHSTSTMPPGAGTRRCSTIRRGPPARWSMHRRKAAA
jgi:phage portal protein BeeE